MLSLGSYDKAEELVRRVIAGRELLFGSFHSDTLTSRFLEGRIKWFQGHTGESARLLNQVAYRQRVNEDNEQAMET